jgi:RNA polymerase sigma factor (sigma-70 family)
MIIPSVGKPKIAYKDHQSVNFESLDFYLNLARKIVAKIGPTFFNGLSKHMLKDEDAISFVANAIMMGDWRWKDEQHQDPDKHLKSLYSYRNQCAIWAIKTYVTKQYKNNHNKKKIKATHSLNHQEDDTNLENIIADTSQQEPIDILIHKENKNSCQQIIDDLLECSLISDKQKEYIKLYYFEDMTLEKIGKKYGITREAVRQSIKTALNKIRKLV